MIEGAVIDVVIENNKWIMNERPTVNKSSKTFNALKTCGNECN